MIITAAAVTLALGIGFTNYWQASTSVQVESEAKIAAVLEARKTALADYLASIEQDLRSTAENPAVRDAVMDFSLAWREIAGDRTAYLQRLYIEENPYPTGQKENLDAAEDGSLYSVHHAAYHPWFRQFLRERAYYDIFLLDLDGNLVYTVFKELDYATNLNSGKWKDTDLGNAFRAALDSKQAGALSFFDFQPYAPSHGAPASFISTPIFEASGRKIGVLVFQMPIDRINAVMSVTAGLGESGEAFIVGGDRLMRNDSRFATDSTILAQTVDNEAVSEALAGNSGTLIADGYRGHEVLSAFAPIDFHGSRWAVVAEVAEAEVVAPINAMRNLMLGVAAGLLALVTVAGVVLSRSITRAIGHLTETMRSLAAGDTSVEIPGRESSDELGDMARAVQVFKANAIEARRLQAEQVERDRRAAEEKREVMVSLADDLEASVKDVIGALANASDEMRVTAESMSQTADKASEQSSAVAAASEQASGNVQTVASAAAQLSAFVSEIGRQVSRSREIAQQAVQRATTTNTTVQGLAEAAQKIGEVVGLISDIAEQTNLLALNATIEAARAGEAGKGFAVVASEVKSLADQTAKATEDISQQIAGMQQVTGETVAAIDEIGTVIDEIGQATTAIASAVEQQGVATQEITRNAQEASHGTQEVTAGIGTVRSAAGDTGAAASTVRAATEQLGRHSDLLRSKVDDFLSQIRAA